MRGLFIILLVFVCVAFVWGGVGNTYMALTNSEPTTVTCGDLAKDPPSAKWLSLTDCEVDYDHVVEIKYKFGVVEGYYVPVVPREGSFRSYPMLVKVESRERLLRLGAQTKITGLVQFGIESEDSVRDAIAESKLRVSKNFMIIDPSEKPALGFALTMLTIGLLIGLYLWRTAVKAFKASEAAAEHDHDDASSPPPPGDAVAPPPPPPSDAPKERIPEPASY